LKRRRLVETVFHKVADQGQVEKIPIIEAVSAPYEPAVAGHCIARKRPQISSSAQAPSCDGRGVLGGPVAVEPKMQFS
jgi:hypothetical protein